MSDPPQGALKLRNIMQSSFIQSGDLGLPQHTEKPWDLSSASRWFPFLKAVYQAREGLRGAPFLLILGWSLGPYRTEQVQQEIEEHPRLGYTRSGIKEVKDALNL